MLGEGVQAPFVDRSNYLNLGGVLWGDINTGALRSKGKISRASDERLKENVEDVTNGLHCVKKLRPITFTRKEVPDPVFEKDSDGNDITPRPSAIKEDSVGSSDVEYGLIAQEVEKVCPELVETSEYAEGYKSIDYSVLSVLLLKAVQEQQEQIEALKKRLHSLEA